MRQDSRNAVLATIIYSDIFDYPLSRDEIKKYYIASTSRIHPDIPKSLDQLHNSHKIAYNHGFYCLNGREKIIKLRRERKKLSKKKITLAQKAANIISHIPTIQLIGLSGSLAMENVDPTDDIDFFIIAEQRTIWITRLCILIILQCMGMRRKRNNHRVKDTICVNMLIDNSKLSLPENKQNLYTAHEVIQMKPLVVRDTIYKDFLFANTWIKKFLPNAIHEKEINQSVQTIKKKEKNEIVSILILVIELLSRKIQLWHMRKHKTTEIITDNFLAFHPIDSTEIVLREFQKRQKIYAI